MRSRAARMSSSVTMGPAGWPRTEKGSSREPDREEAFVVDGSPLQGCPSGLRDLPLRGPRILVAGEGMAVHFGNGKAGERIVLVDETQANRPTVEAYELITRKLRVPRVPLLFRALAGEKALL